MGLFSDLFSTKPAEDAARDKIAGINTGLTAATSALDAGQAGADALYGKAYQPFTTLANYTRPGADAYGDATGANGPEGLARAKAQFTSTPGYTSGFDLLTDANDRRAASRGILASGNTIADTAKLATTYADQNYGNYVNRLAPYLPLQQGAQTTAATGGGAVLGTQAGADLGVAGTKANLGYGANTAIGNANADKDQASYTASQNFWNALMGGAKLAVSAAAGGLSSLGGGGGPTFTGNPWGSASGSVPMAGRDF